jgi:uncharacterized protein YjdB
MISNCPAPGVDSSASSFRWSSSAPSVVEADSLTGIIRARALGNTTITVAYVRDRTVKSAALVMVR